MKFFKFINKKLPKRAHTQLCAGASLFGTSAYLFSQSPAFAETLDLPNIFSFHYLYPTTILNRREGSSRLYAPAQKLDKKLEQELMNFLRENIVWEERSDNHDVSWYVDSPCECYYEYDSGEPQPYNVMPAWMLNLRHHMLLELKLPLDNPPNSCNINWYKTHQAHIGAHADDEILFGPDFPVQIISFSLGAERRFEIWENEKVIKSLILPTGSFMTMEGLFQKYFKHAIPIMNKFEKDVPRLNITWRWVVNHVESCPLHKT